MADKHVISIVTPSFNRAASLAIASFFYLCYFAGDMLTRLAPAWAAQHFTVEG